MQIVKNRNTNAVFVVRENSQLLADSDFFVVTKESYYRLCDFAKCPELKKLSIKNEVIFDNHGIAEKETDL